MKHGWDPRLIFGLALAFALAWLAAPLPGHGACESPVCGNGMVEIGEQCDDGNLAAGDGCGPDCSESFDLVSGPALLTYSDGYPRDMAAADLNNDGVQDLLVTTFRSAYLYSYLTTPGGLVLKGKYALGTNTLKIDTGNLNGDHFIDVVSIDASTDQLHIFFGNGDGALTLANIFTPGYRPMGVTVGDINSDGFNDIVAGCLDSGGFRIYYGNGQGGFPQNEFLSTGGEAFNSEIFDYNGDGYNDLAIGADVSASQPAFFIYRGGPAGLTLSQTFNIIYNGIPTALDQDGDGHMDLYSVYHALTNQGDGNFVLNRMGEVTKPGSHLDTGDLDNDGFKDIAISTRNFSEVRVFRADRQGWFLPELAYPMPDETDGAVILDVNLDGTPDVLGAVYYNSSQRKVVPVYNHNYYQFPRCGDGRIGRGENCDDGNAADGDGCSAVCRIEVSGDTDHDGLTDNEEIFIHGTDPLSPDTDLDCVFDGDEICAGADPLDPSDQEGCQEIITPAGQWKIQVTLREASAGLQSDVWLAEPVEERLIKNTLKNVGKVATTHVLSGETVVFFIRVDAGSWGLGTYDHYSNSIFGRVSRIDAYKYTVSFEDLPVEMADWDYNDVVLLVEFLPEEGAEGIAQNTLSEFQATVNAAPDQDASMALPFDGFASANVPGAGLTDETAVVLTAGLPENYADLTSAGFKSGGKYAKLSLTNGQTQLSNGAVAQVMVAYDDDDQDGVMDDTDITEQYITLARWDDDGESWVALDSSVDPVANTVTADTDQAGLFTVGTKEGSIQVDCGILPANGVGSVLWLLVLLPALGIRLARARKS